MRIRNLTECHGAHDLPSFGAFLAAALILLLALTTPAPPAAAQFGSIAAHDFQNYLGAGPSRSRQQGIDAVRRWTESQDGPEADGAREALDEFVE